MVRGSDALRGQQGQEPRGQGEIPRENAATPLRRRAGTVRASRGHLAGRAHQAVDHTLSLASGPLPQLTSRPV